MKKSEVKTEIMLVRVSPLEKATIVLAAARQDTRPATFIREAAVKAARRVT